MSATRRILGFMLFGAILGLVVASFAVPPALGWYNSTGKIAGANPVETLCNVPELIRYATTRLLEGQLIGAVAGAILFAVVGGVTRRRHAASTLPAV